MTASKTKSASTRHAKQLTVELMWQLQRLWIPSLQTSFLHLLYAKTGRLLTSKKDSRVGEIFVKFMAAFLRNYQHPLV